MAEASSSHVGSVDVELQERWAEAFTTYAPHQLTSDIDIIKGLFIHSSYFQSDSNFLVAK